jgi:arylsulfatase A-like enzyme
VRTGRTTLALALALPALAALALGPARDDARSQAPARPNIVLIETDDQTVESMRVLTRVRALIGDEGATFENSFASFALCCPSRATTLTGQYAHNHGVLGNAPPEGGYAKLDSTNTLPVWLQRAGYYTAHLGKYLNGYGRANPREIPPGWSEWRGSVDPSTYRFNGYTLNENGTLTTYQRYQTDLYADKAVEIVTRRAREAQPFFLWVAFLAPHSGAPRDADDPRNLATARPADRHRNRFAAEALPAPPSFNEADVSDKPAAIRNRPLLQPARIAAVREMYQQRLESLLAVDEAVDRIVGSLRASGELDNTLIVFTSDNGFFHGEHRVPNGKVLLYEPSIRVPLLMRGPGVPRGVRLVQPVVNVDVAPTIVAAARATPGRRLDGRSLLGLLRDQGRHWGRDVVLERGPGPATFTAIRTPRYLYAEHGSGERELYDLAADPDQLTSRHGDAAYARIRSELARRLLALRNCAGSACQSGPRVVARASCLRGRPRVTVSGPDVALVTRLDLLVRGRRVASDTRRPFALTLRAVPRGATLRARTSYADGRLLTQDRRAPRC